jgi:lipopolysaccharide transport system permease protein
MLLDTGTFAWTSFGYTALISMVVFLLGLVIFNRTEKQFIDTV